MNFKWRTEEEQSWRGGEEQSAALVSGRFVRRGLWIAAVLALLGVAAYFAWNTVRERAEMVEDQVRGDVLAIHALARQAADEKDHDLFRTLLAPDDAAWVGAQEELLEADLLFSEAARMYGLSAAAGSEAVVEVALDPDLQQAVVTVQQAFGSNVFEANAEDALSGTVTLEQTAFYRQSSDGWRLSPPPAGFWAPVVTLDGEMVTIEYPLRDETVALRLLTDVEALLPRVCALPGLQCPPDFQARLILSADPSTLVKADDPEALLIGNTEIILPAPTLAGRPLDQAGVEMASRTYKTLVAGKLFSHLAGYECCRHGLFARAVLERQLYHLGLRPWPLEPAEYEVLMEQGMSAAEAYLLQERDSLRASEEASLRVMSLVEFLEASLPQGSLLPELNGSLELWLAAQEDRDARFAVAWTEFAYSRSRSGQMDAALGPLPQADIRLTCQDDEGQTVLWSYDLQHAGWHSAFVYEPEFGWNVHWIDPLPGGYGHVVQEGRRTASGQRAVRYIWYSAGQKTVLFESTGEDESKRLFGSYDGSSPLWRYAALRIDHYSEQALTEQEWWLLDLGVCHEDGCSRELLEGRPMWSPDGRQMLLEVREPATGRVESRTRDLYRAGQQGQNGVQVGSGYSPFWVDSSHYGYLSTGGEGIELERWPELEQEVVIAATADDVGYVVAESADFMALPDVNGVQRLELERVRASPTDPRLLLVQASYPSAIGSGNTGANYLFSVRLAPDLKSSEQIKLLVDANGGLTFELSPTGRWVAVSSEGEWMLIDLESGERRSLGDSNSAVAWSPDGGWLAQWREQYLLLHVPALDYKRVVLRDLSGCHSVDW